MKIKVDENGYVVGFVTLGDMDGAEEYSGEIPEGFTASCRSYRIVNGQLIKDEEKAAELQRSKKAAFELSEIYEWFSWYDNQCAQYQRAQRLGLDFDQDIDELDAMAQEKQARIRELKGM